MSDDWREEAIRDAHYRIIALEARAARWKAAAKKYRELSGIWAEVCVSNAREREE